MSIAAAVVASEGRFGMDVASFAGAPFQQTWYDLPLWELFFNRFPCRSVVELGTGQGGMAIFFAVQALRRGMKFTTFDRERLYDDQTYKALGELGARCHLVELFDRAEFVRGLLSAQERPLVLFCDNGDKPREFREFRPVLTSGDYVAVHDWNAEIRLSDIQPELPMVLADECDKTGSITRFFRVP